MKTSNMSEHQIEIVSNFPIVRSSHISQECTFFKNLSFSDGTSVNNFLCNLRHGVP